MTNGSTLHYSGPVFTNCTFSGNSAAPGGVGGAYNEGYGSGKNPENHNETLYRFPTFENCIFWDNTDRQIVNENSVGVSVTYCVVQDGSSGITGGGTISEIISDDPNLQPLGEYGGATKTIAIGPGSSAKDKGTSSVFGHVVLDVAKDQRGFPRDGSYDIGSYECRDDLNILTVAVTGLGTVGRAPSGEALTSSNQWIYSRDLPVTLTAVPISSNHFKGWGGALSGTASSTQLTMTEDRFVTAKFGDSWTILATAGGGGTITPSGHVRVRQGTDQTFAISANSGYSLSEVTVDGTSVGTPSSYTFSNVTEDHSISAVFSGNEEEEEWIIAAQAGEGGTISPSGAVRVPNGGSVTFAISAESPFTTKDVVVDGTSQGALSSYTFSNVRANHDIKALFFTDAWTIDASADEDGTISPSGSVTVPHGENVTFTITPEEGQTIEGVTVDGAFAGRGEIYLFTDVRSNHTIEASFSDNATDGGASAGCQVGGAPLSYFWLFLPLVLLRRGKR